MFQKVTEDMSFEQTLNVIDAQIPSEHKGTFYSALESTLLDTTIEGVTEPAVIQWMEPKNVEDLGLPGLLPAYQMVYTQYNLDAIIDDVTA